MKHPIPTGPVAIPVVQAGPRRGDLALCTAEFRRGRLSEAGFRHHLARLGYLAHEIEAEIAHHRTDREAA